MADERTNNLELDVDGTELLTEAIMTLLNTCPLLESGDEIRFSELNENNGLGMFPLSGGLIQNDMRDILGHRTQYCQYPFYIIYRVGQLNESRKVNAKEWLDNIGRWLERQPITIGQTTYQLEEYPTLTGSRKIKYIHRTTPSFLSANNSNNTEDWTISITVDYTNQF